MRTSENQTRGVSWRGQYRSFGHSPRRFCRPPAYLGSGLPRPLSAVIFYSRSRSSSGDVHSDQCSQRAFPTWGRKWLSTKNYFLRAGWATASAPVRRSRAASAIGRLHKFLLFRRSTFSASTARTSDRSCPTTPIRSPTFPRLPRCGEPPTISRPSCSSRSRKCRTRTGRTLSTNRFTSHAPTTPTGATRWCNRRRPPVAAALYSSGSGSSGSITSRFRRRPMCNCSTARIRGKSAPA